MRRGTLATCVLAASLVASAAPAFGASKNVQLVGNLPEAKNATAINFLDYSARGRGSARTARTAITET